MPDLKDKLTAGDIKTMQFKTPGKPNVLDRKSIGFYLFVTAFSRLHNQPALFGRWKRETDEEQRKIQG